MSNTTRVELVRVKRPADPDVIADRTDLAARMDDAGMIDAGSGEVNTDGANWLARINGVEIDVLDFALSHGDDDPVLSLVFPVAGLSVTDNPEPQPAPAPAPRQVDPPKAATTWGADGKPDPREGIASWKPEARA